MKQIDIKPKEQVTHYKAVVDRLRADLAKELITKETSNYCLDMTLVSAQFLYPDLFWEIMEAINYKETIQLSSTWSFK